MVSQPLDTFHISCELQWHNPDSKVYGAIMGPIWGRQDPGGPHVGPINCAIWESFSKNESGGRLNMNMLPCQYGDSYYKDTTVSRPSCLYNGYHHIKKALLILRRHPGVPVITLTGLCECETPRRSSCIWRCTKYEVIVVELWINFESCIHGVVIVNVKAVCNIFIFHIV